jgi:carboxymethylenebutenolidase
MVVKSFVLLAALTLLSTASASAQDWAKEKLDKSPRHLDWVTLKNGDHSFKCFIAYPEASKKSPAVLVLHENVGLTDWVREMADEIASQGYIAIVPDMLNSKTYTSQDDARKAVAELTPEQVTSELNAAAEYVTHVPSTDGKLAVAGFCWGGGQAFHYASVNPKLKAAFVFYGMPPSAEDMAHIKEPVYGFYGGNDNRVTATVDPTKASMKSAGKTYSPEIYADAGHGFMRAGEAPDATSGVKQARDKAWHRFVSLLKQDLK